MNISQTGPPNLIRTTRTATRFKTISHLITVLDLLPIIEEFLPDDVEDKDIDNLQIRLEAQLSRQLESHLLASRTSSAAALRWLEDGLSAILLSDQCVQQSGQQSAHQPHIAPGMVLPVPISSITPAPQPPPRGAKRKRERCYQQAATASRYDDGEQFSSETEREVKRWREQDAAIEAAMRERDCDLNDSNYSDIYSSVGRDGYRGLTHRLSQYRIWAQGTELDSYLPSETETLASEDATQIELWRLISQAPNLASLTVASHKWLGKDVDQPPVWILPIILATQSVDTNPRYHGWFEKLHTLKFSMNGQCGTWLVHILSLPCLETLRVGSWGIQPYADWEASLVWPEPTATSRVSDLSFWYASVPADIIVRIMDYCIALKSFSCDRAYNRDRRVDMHGQQWSTEVLAGLQRHRQTLTSLYLRPAGKISVLGFEPESARVEGFQTLVALESLTVDWYILMGSQAGSFNSDWNSGWEPVGDWTYPELREVLPKNLRHLSIDKTRSSTPGCMGIEQALCAAVARRDSNAEENDVFLSAGVHFVYYYVHPHKALPMNLWRVKDVYEKAGYRFEYKLRLDPLQFIMDSTEGVQSSIAKFGKTLADEGPAGVHMALCSDCPGLAGKVMKLLGLQKEWLDTEEAKEVLFGDEVGAWALGTS
ncbi:hypothetical protein E8E13_002945 [Curvularia kusanoi]|uniref:Uncharacterized protein n=1 Tax=Curvularia kusanoi TaxID=90978 RepID=A0A9P4T5D8_CURKU|nr:hypothetical protein E8E13_002945 [Curvularia kusanoi]